jgi:membrane protein DedA with SNARE-associated domain
MVLVLAGFAAHQGYLDPIAVVATAAASAFAGNQFFFWLGRRHGNAVLTRFPSLAGHAAEIRRLIEHHPSAAAVAVRFIYGTRIAGPILIGTTAMSRLRFTLLNGLAAAVWALLIGGAGWLFGKAAAHLLGRLAHFEGWLFAALLAALIVWRLARRRPAGA